MTNPSRMQPLFGKPLVFDLIGLGLLGATIGWTYLAAGGRGDPGSVAALLLGSAASFVAARALGRLHPALVPAVVVGVAAVVMLRATDTVFSREPLMGPLGYANAKASFFLQAAIAGVMLVACRRLPVALRAAGGAAAVTFGVVPVASHSLAAAVLVATLPLAALAVRGTKAARAAVIALGGTFALTLLATIVLGITFGEGDRTGPVARLVNATVTERRVTLWREAMVIMAEHPRGVGPGNFAVASHTARSDRDARWAHNAFLQQGAEAGMIGFVLSVSLFLWGFARLLIHPAPDMITVLGAVSIAALGIHSSIDYVAHFAAVPVTVAALAGTAAASRARRKNGASRVTGAGSFDDPNAHQTTAIEEAP